MTIRPQLLGLCLALTAGSAFALPPPPSLPPPPPSPRVVAHRVQSDVDRVADRIDARVSDHDRGHHYARGDRHHHRRCVRHGRHGACRRWGR